MALWMYGFLVVSAELSGQNATVHGRNLEELVDCGVCKAVPLSTCKYCHEGSSSSSPSQPRRRRARRRRTVPQLELGSHEPRRRQPRRRSPGGSSASPSNQEDEEQVQLQVMSREYLTAQPPTATVARANVFSQQLHMVPGWFHNDKCDKGSHQLGYTARHFKLC